MDENIPLPEVVASPPEKSHRPRKTLLIILAGIGTFALLALIVYILFSINSSKQTTNSSISPTPTPLATIRTAPVFTSQSYEYSGALPAAKNLMSYTLKSDFTDDEAIKFANNFGLTSLTSKAQDTLYFYEISDPENAGLMAFNVKSGAFVYNSYGNLAPKDYIQGQSATSEATSFLTQIGMHDNTINCSVTYKRRDTPNVSYVECHRDWSQLGAPLVSPVGLLNPGKQLTLKDAFPGKTTPDSLDDASVYEVSSGTDGKIRPNDFNTITLGFYPDGRVHSVQSTLRFMNSTAPNELSKILTPKEALNNFIENKGNFSLSIPSGTGIIDWDKVYPNNKAQATVATIREFTPAYLEKPITSSQTAYSPYYLIYGTATLSSGYLVDFVSTVPALRDGKAVLAASTKKEAPIEIGTFNPVTPTPQPILDTTPTVPASEGTTPTPQPPTGPNAKTTCMAIDENSGLTQLQLEIPGYGKMTVAANLGVTSSTGSHNAARTYYFVSDKLYSASPEFTKIRNAFFQAVDDQYTIIAAKIITGTNKDDKGRVKKNQTTDGLVGGITSRGYLPSTISNCTPEYQASPAGSCFDMPRAQSVATSVQQKINKMKNDPAYLAEIAAKSNIFPDRTLESLNFVFSYYNALNALPKDFKAKANEKIVCYITGESPRIFLYGSNMNVSIRSGADITYSEVPHINKTWAGKLQNNSFISSKNESFSSIYYEYDPTHARFKKSTKGFSTVRNEVSRVVTKISEKLGLTNTETDALIVDTNNALFKLPNAKLIDISVISESEINRQLPLIISPKPTNIHRVHLLLTQSDKLNIYKEPTLKRINREGFTAVEIGATTQEN